MEPAPAEDTVAFNPKAAQQRRPPSHLDVHFIEARSRAHKLLQSLLMGRHSRGRSSQARGVGASLVGHCIQDVGSVSCWEGVWGRCRQVKDSFPAVQSGGWYSGRGAIFPVESCVVQTKQTQIPASPEWFITVMQLLFQYLKEKKKKGKNPTLPISSPSPSLQCPCFWTGDQSKFSELYCVHMPIC